MNSNYDPNFLPECQPEYFTTLQNIADNMENSRYIARYKDKYFFREAEEHSENKESFDCLFQRLKQITVENGDEFHFAWDMDGLSKCPYEALRSWQKAYQEYSNKDCVPDNSQDDFMESTFFLLCCLQPEDRDRGINPWKDHLLLLQKSFEHIREVYWLYRKMYMHLSSRSNNDTWDAKSNEIQGIYSYELYCKTDWPIYSTNVDALLDKVKAIAKGYLQKCKCNIDFKTLNSTDLSYSINQIKELSCKDAYISFFFPFFCAKLFLLLLCHNSSSANDYELSNQLFSFETLERSFSKHQNKRILTCEQFDALISFMKDTIAEVYQYEEDCASHDRKEKSFAAVPPQLLDSQMDCNWLALYLYGNGRYFGEKEFPFEYSQLTLPTLIRHLFKNNEDENISLDFDWCFQNFPEWDIDEKMIKKLEKHKLTENLVMERDALGLLIDPFDGTLWQDETFIPTRDSQIQIAKTVNRVIDQYAKILMKNKKKSKDAIDYVRLSCARELIFHIEEDIDDCIDKLSTIEGICTMCSQVFDDEWTIADLLVLYKE